MDEEVDEQQGEWQPRINGAQIGSAIILATVVAWLGGAGGLALAKTVTRENEQTDKWKQQ